MQKVPSSILACSCWSRRDPIWNFGGIGMTNGGRWHIPNALKVLWEASERHFWRKPKVPFKCLWDVIWGCWKFLCHWVPHALAMPLPEGLLPILVSNAGLNGIIVPFIFLKNTKDFSELLIQQDGHYNHLIGCLKQYSTLAHYSYFTITSLRTP